MAERGHHRLDRFWVEADQQLEEVEGPGEAHAPRRGEDVTQLARLRQGQH